MTQRCWRRAEQLGGRVYEFTEFLTDVLGISDVHCDDATPKLKVAYHPSCHLLREMRVREGPRTLLSNCESVELVELPDAEQCCGFGGTFAVKYPHISEEMLSDKLASIQQSGADAVTACDMGCLMHIGGAVSRRNLPISVRHVAQILDGGQG